MQSNLALEELLAVSGKDDEVRAVEEFFKGTVNENPNLTISKEETMCLSRKLETIRVCDYIRKSKRAKNVVVKSLKSKSTIGIRIGNWHEHRVFRSMRRQNMNVIKNKCCLINKEVGLRGTPDLLLKKKVGRNNTRMIVYPVEVKSSHRFVSKGKLMANLSERNPNLELNEKGQIIVRRGSQWEKQVICYCNIIGVDIGYLGFRMGRILHLLKINKKEVDPKVNPPLSCEDSTKKALGSSGLGFRKDTIPSCGGVCE